MRKIDLERADVYCDDRLAGTLERTDSGSRFTYHPDFSQALAFRIPHREEPYEHPGDNLPPFFANLLPEGMRLNALIARARTSASDMFTLLLEAGPECVGDIYAVPAGTDPAPIAPLAVRTLNKADFSETLARVLEGAPDGAIPGVQEKLSISDATINFPVRDKTVGSAILKLSPDAFPYLVENEALFLDIARRCGFKVPAARIVKDSKGRTGLLVSRFDRIKRENILHRVHQEDGCQLTDRYPADKYRLSLRQITESITEFVAAPLPQTLELIRRYAFAYFIGNGDLHAKNISLYRSPATGLIEQTPMYDIISTLAYPHLTPRMALQVDGKDDHFKLAHFIQFGERFGVRPQATQMAIETLIRKLKPQIEKVNGLPYEEKIKERLQTQIISRLEKF